MGRKKASEYTLIAYCGWNLFWMWLGMRLYVEHLMTRVKIGPLDLNIDQSNLLFFVLMGLCELTGMFSAWYNRTGCQIAANILFPLEIYTALAYFERWHPAVRVLFAAACAAVIWYFITFFRAKRRETARKKLRMAWLSGRVVFSTLFSVFLLLSMPDLLPGGRGAAPASRELLSESRSDLAFQELLDEEVWTLEAQEETIGMLREYIWEDLDTEERLEVLQTVANVECVNLGLPYMPRVTAEKCPDYILGQYSYAEHMITFNIDVLPSVSGLDMLDAVLHECQHAYQFACVEIYQAAGEEYRDLSGFRMFWQAEEWAEEFINYEDGSSGTEESMDAYRGQACEMAAREGAEREMEKYMVYLK